MDDYVKTLTDIIRRGSMDNTYKMAWARSLVEHSFYSPNQNQIHFDELAPLIFKYYWNQIIYFQLEQGPRPSNKPVICQIVEEKIKDFQCKHDYQPIGFMKVENRIEIPVARISTVLKENVSRRFQRVGRDEHALYDLNSSDRKIFLHRPDLLKEYSEILFELINYRWTQKLEELNHSVPRIAQKVRGTDRENIRRKSLQWARKYLDKENPSRTCFISGSPIEKDKLSIDHVIPWSYLYSDDLWNFVYVDKDLNSSKNKRLPHEDMIKRLEERNVKLLQIIENSEVSGKHVEELKLCIDGDYVRKSWIGCKG